MNLKHSWTHYLGLSASFLCLIHCLALPLITPFLPLLASHNHWVVEGVFVLLISLSTLTIYRGFREHEDARALWLGVVAFALLLTSLLLEHHSLQIVLSVSGAALMTTAHYLNFKLCRVTDHCCDQHRH